MGLWKKVKKLKHVPLALLATGDFYRYKGIKRQQETAMAQLFRDREVSDLQATVSRQDKVIDELTRSVEELTRIVKQLRQTAGETDVP